MNKEELIKFEAEVAQAFDDGLIRSPIHLSGGNEDSLIAIFDNIAEDDWVFSTHRSHYHALLHGVPREKVMAEILAGHSMNLNFPEHNFYTSAIVGGILPIALGVAAGIKRNVGKNTAWDCIPDSGAIGGKRWVRPEWQKDVWVFVGDMAASMGIFWECLNYAQGHDLPIMFVIEDNGLATNTPTAEAWGDLWGRYSDKIIHYEYMRTYPHTGTGSGKRVEFNLEEKNDY